MSEDSKKVVDNNTDEINSTNDDKNKPHSKFAISSKLILLVILGVVVFYLIYNM